MSDDKTGTINIGGTSIDYGPKDDDSGTQWHSEDGTIKGSEATRSENDKMEHYTHDYKTGGFWGFEANTKTGEEKPLKESSGGPKGYIKNPITGQIEEIE